MIESGGVPGKGRIRASIKIVPTSTGKGSNLCEYRKMIQSGRVPGKGRIRESNQQLFSRVPEKSRICGSTEKQ